MNTSNVHALTMLFLLFFAGHDSCVDVLMEVRGFIISPTVGCLV
jgi:hypothetical protein